MTPVRGLAAVLVRVATMTVLYVVFVAVLSNSETTDALGTGLLFFAATMVVTFVWGGFDGARWGFVAATLVWLVASVLMGATVSVAALVIDDSAVEVSGIVFLALIWFVPAVVGAAFGGVVHRNRTSVGS